MQSPEISVLQEKTLIQTTETGQETNEKGVPMEAITTFVNGLKLQFGVAKEAVLERLRTNLTPKKLESLIYFQDQGHQLDVTVINAAGELEFDTCSLESPRGENINKNYFEALEIATNKGATLMTEAKYKWIRSQGIILDINYTWSWLFTPAARRRKKIGHALGGDNGVVYKARNPYQWFSNGSFRVTLTV